MLEDREREEVTIMIERALAPFNKVIAIMETRANHWFGDGNGRPGRLDQIEATQDKRWEESRRTQSKLFDRIEGVDSRIAGKLDDMKDNISTLNGKLDAGEAVKEDRRFNFVQVLTVLAIIADIAVHIFVRGK